MEGLRANADIYSRLRTQGEEEELRKKDRDDGINM